MTNKSIYEKHCLLLDAVNNAQTITEHDTMVMCLESWRSGVKDAGAYGSISLIDADMYYLDQGIDRPMCGGVWLDWKPCYET